MILHGDTSAGASADTNGESGIFNLHSSLLARFTPEQSRSVKTRGCNRLHIELGVRTANEMLPSPIWFSGSGVSSELPCTGLNSSRAGKGNNPVRQNLRNRPTFFLSLTSHLRY